MTSALGSEREGASKDFALQSLRDGHPISPARDAGMAAQSAYLSLILLIAKDAVSIESG